MHFSICIKSPCAVHAMGQKSLPQPLGDVSGITGQTSRYMWHEKAAQKLLAVQDADITENDRARQPVLQRHDVFRRT